MNKLTQLYHSIDQYGDRRWPWFKRHYLKIAFAVVLIIFVIGLMGCSKNNNAASMAPPKPKSIIDMPDTDAKKWMCVMEVWHCDDGSYHLQTRYTLRGIYPTIEQAREAKTNWANEMVSAVKEGLLNVQIPTVPHCGSITN